MRLGEELVDAADGVLHDAFAVGAVAAGCEHALDVHELVDLHHHFQQEPRAAVLALHPIPALVLRAFQVSHVGEILKNVKVLW